MKPREPVPVLCATLVPSGSCEGSRVFSFCQQDVEPEPAQLGGAAQLARDRGVRGGLENQLEQQPLIVGRRGGHLLERVVATELGRDPEACVVPVMPIASHQRWILPSPTRSTTVPVHVLSLTMIIITIASRRVIQNPGVRCWKVPESLSWYLDPIVTF